MGRTELAGDLLAVAVSMAGVHLLFPARVDISAHLLAGAAVSLVVAALLRARTAPRLVSWSVAVTLIVAVVAEGGQPGVVDFGDVAFTGAGALLMARSTVSVARAGRRPKAAAVALGVVLLSLAWIVRYGW